MKLLLQTNVVFPDGQMRIAGTVFDPKAEGVNGEAFISNKWATEHKGPMPKAEPVEPPAPIEPPASDPIEPVAPAEVVETVAEVAPEPVVEPEPAPKKRSRK